MTKELIYTILLLFATMVSAQDWQIVQQGGMDIPPNAGCFINADSGWYVGSGGAVVRTVNGGLDGQTIKKPEDGTASWKDVQFVNHLLGYVCAEDGLIFKTEDAGLTWEMIADTLLTQEDLLKIAVVGTDTIFVSGKKSTFLKSVDGGESWIKSEYAFEQDLDAGIAFCNSQVGVVAADKKGSFTWYTRDGGASWNPVTIAFPAGTTISSLKAVEAVGDSTIILSGWHQAKFISTDGGKSYTTIGLYTPEYDSYSSLDALSENQFFFGGQNGYIEKTNDAGLTWQHIDIPTGEDVVFVDFITESEGYVFAKYGQWYKTVDGGLTWDPIMDWPNISFLSASSPQSETIFLCGWNGQSSKSTDGGQNFTYPSNKMLGSRVHLRDCVFYDSENGLIGDGDGELYRTADGGNSWILIDADHNPMYKLGKTIYSIDYLDKNLVVAGGSSGKLIKSTDGGLSWSELYTPESKTIYDVHFVSDSLLMVGAQNGRVYFSNAALDSVNYGRFQKDVYDDILDIETRGNVCLAVDYDGYILRTTTLEIDTLVEVYKAPDRLNGLVFVTDNIVYAVGDNGQVFRSEDAGLGWAREDSLTDNTLWNIGFDGKKLWAVGQNGMVLAKDVTGQAIDEENPQLTLDYKLEQNFPNPFNPATSIQFFLPVSGKTVLTIYNVNGQKVGTILDRNLGIGTTRVTWDASQFASGIYFYELKSGNYSSVRKMILVK